MAKRTPFQRAEFRQERLLRDREAIRVLREHFTGYNVADGFSLNVRKIAQMPYWQRRALRKKYAKVQRLLDTPHVDLVKPKSDEDRKALRRFTHQRMRDMKHYIVQKPSEQSRVRVVEGQVEVSTKFPGKAAFTERYFMFETQPESPDEMLEMLDELLEDAPAGGTYTLLTDTYGDTGDLGSRKQIREILARYLGKYDNPKYEEHRFLYRIVGVRWFRTTREGKETRLEQQSVRDRVREQHRQELRELREEAHERAERESAARNACPTTRHGKRCLLPAGHPGQHRFPK